MADLTVRKSVLYRTCGRNDVKISGNEAFITGLDSIPLNMVSSISQVKYKAEVAQVVTVGNTSYTPTASTTYQAVVNDILRKTNGYNNLPIPYSWTTPPVLSTIGATEALQREYIHGKLVEAINNDSANNHATAASLGTGTGFTVTDTGSYYPVFAQGNPNTKGKNAVYPVTNDDGTGFASDNFTITTAAVYSFGVGAKLATEKPIVDYVYGNVVSGYISNAPVTTTGLPAVSGQNYDGYIIQDYKLCDAITIGGQYAYQVRIQRVFADNGTGSSTTNLTGYKAFERQMHKLMTQVYSNDPSCLREFFDSLLGFQDPLGAAPSGTADILGWQLSPAYNNGMYRINIGTQTIVAPVLNDLGLLLDQDDTATEGSHTCASIHTVGEDEFVVGQTPFMVGCRVVAGDWTDVQFLFGFRIKAAYAADYNNYTDLAAIGGGAADGDSITTFGILNNAATVATDTAVNFADAVSIMMWIKVDINGAVTCHVNGTEYPVYSVGTTPLVFDAGDAMIPFYQVVNIGSGDPATVISEFFAVPTNQLIN